MRFTLQLRYLPSALFLSTCLIVLTLFVPSVAQEDDSGGFKYLEVKVLDLDGKPMTDVEVEVSIDGAGFSMQVDDDGMIAFNVPRSGSRFTLMVQHEGYAAIGALWNDEDEVPEEFTIQMQKGVVIGGVVHDENGQPVEGVSVKGTILYGNHVGGGKGKGDLRPMLNAEIATTDSEGRWQSDCASEREVHLQIKVSHPNYVSGKSVNFVDKTYKQLQSLDKIFVLRTGVDLRGRVLSPKGDPIVGAKFFLGRSRYSSNKLKAETNELGEYQISNAPPGITVLTVTSTDWAPELLVLELSRGMQPLVIQLKPGKTVRIRVADPQGDPIEGARVSPDSWRSYETLDNRNREKTDANGLWQWHHAPLDEIRYTMSRAGFFSTSDYAETTFSPGEETHEVTLLPAVVISGSVVDKETRQPIKDFTYCEGVWWNPEYTRYVLQTSNVEVGRDGTLRHVMDNGCTKFLLKIVADGYLPALSRPIFPKEGKVTIDFVLEAGLPPSGIVKLPDGRSAAGTEVVMATPDRYVSIQDGRVQNRHDLISTTCDDEGYFAFSLAERVYTLVCLHDDGYAYLESSQFEELPEIVLQPWSQVTGQVKRGTQTLGGEQVSLVCSPGYVPGQPRINWSSKSETDESGNFTFERVKAGTAAVMRRVRYADRASASSHTVKFEVLASEMTQVVIGGEGQKLMGRLAMPEDYSGDVSWKMGIVQLVEQKDSDEEKPSQQTYSPFDLRYASAILSDGTYEIHDVLPGEYKITVSLYPKVQPMGRWKPIGTLTQTVMVPEGEGEAEVIDLGEYVLEIPEKKPQL